MPPVDTLQLPPSGQNVVVYEIREQGSIGSSSVASSAPASGPGTEFVTGVSLLVCMYGLCGRPLCNDLLYLLHSKTETALNHHWPSPL